MAAETTVVHLLRHGEVHNPDGIVYGRLPGYSLSEDGVLMAKSAASWLAQRPITAVFSSPLQRARETADEVESALGVPVRVDERLTEAGICFEGKCFDAGASALRHPAHWVHLRNPFRPSWGEPYARVAARMLAAVSVARDTAGTAGNAEAVCITHQLPIWVVRRAVDGRSLWHLPHRRQCALASVTSLTYVGDRIVSMNYVEPAGHVMGSAGA